MFLRQYTNLQLGFTNVDMFRRAEETRKIYTLNNDKRLQLPALSVNATSGASTAMCIDPSDRFLLTGYKNGAWVIIDCWSIVDNKYKIVKESGVKQKRAISSLLWFTDSGSFSSCSLDGSLNIYDTNNSGEPISTFGSTVSNTHEYNKHAVNPINPTMIAASCNLKNKVYFIDLRVGSEIQNLPELEGNHPIPSALSWSPASQYIMTVGTKGGYLLEWDIRSTRRYLKCYESARTRFREPLFGHTSSTHKGDVLSIKYSEDGQKLFTYGIGSYLYKFCTGTSVMEESVCFGSSCQDNNWAFISIHVFENLEQPIVVVPTRRSLSILNMATGVGGFVAQRSCNFLVSGFTYNRTILKGFVYGETSRVFSVQSVDEEINDVKRALIDVSDL